MELFGFIALLLIVGILAAIPVGIVALIVYIGRTGKLSSQVFKLESKIRELTTPTSSTEAKEASSSVIPPSPKPGDKLEPVLTEPEVKEASVMEFNCTNCGKLIMVKYCKPGESAVCPECGADVVVPPGADQPPAPEIKPPEPAHPGQSGQSGGPPAADVINRLIPEIPFITTIAALVLIFLFDYFIYQSKPDLGGVGLGVLFLVTGLLMWRIEGSPVSKTILFCAILLAIFAVRTIWQAVATTEIIGFLMLFTFSSAVKRFSLHLMELWHSFWWTFLQIPRLFIGISRPIARLSGDLPRWTRLGLRIGLVWVIPIAIALVFLFIFAMANAVVESWINIAGNWAWDQFVHIFDFIAIGRIFFWICSLFFAVLLLLPQSVKNTILTPFLGKEEALQPTLVSASVDLKETIAINTLIAVNLLFVFYNAVDIWFLWFKGALPGGLNYSTYARTGTAYLTIALALTSLVMGIMFIRDLNFHRRAPLLRILSWVWVAQNLVIAIDTFRRLQVYIDYNGLTRMRIVGAYGIALVVIGLLIVAVKMHNVRTFLWMVRRHLLALGLALLALAITPMDWLVTRYNTGIILYDNLRPAIQLIVQPLTAEGIPGLIPLLDSRDAAIREGVAGILLREQHNLQMLKDKEERLADKELSRSYALKLIEPLQPRLKQLVPDGNYDEAINKLKQYVWKWY